MPQRGSCSFPATSKNTLVSTPTAARKTPSTGDPSRLHSHPGQPVGEEIDADFDLGRHGQPGRIDRPDVGLLEILRQYGDQHSVFDLPSDIPNRPQNDAVTIDGPLADNFTVVCRQRTT